MEAVKGGEAEGRTRWTPRGWRREWPTGPTGSPRPTGLTFHFGEYQFGGAGIRSYTVRGPRARLVLSAYGEKLLARR